MHTTKVLNGNKIAADIRARLKKKIAHSKVKPGLAVVLVGHDPASQMYVEFKGQASQEVGMHLETYELPENTSQKKLLKLIDKLNRKKKIHGILVQLPLPGHLHAFEVMQAIHPAKDVDGFHPENVGWLSIGKPYVLPATTKGIKTLIGLTDVDLRGSHVVMVGTSNIVGKPTAQWFLNQGATVTLCNRNTQDLAAHTKEADILVTATGVRNLITADMVQKNAVVIDAGIVRHKGETVGDVDYESVSKKAKYITPVPGGVGPMTVASLLENTWIAMRRIEGFGSHGAE